MVVLLEGSPIPTEELCQNNHRVLGHLPDQGPSHPIAQFGWAASCCRKTVGPYIERCVPFQIMSNQLNLPQVYSNQVVETSHG